MMEESIVHKHYEKTEEAVARLNTTQFTVTQQGSTEPDFRNAFWDHKEEGLYVDVVSGEPLFSSQGKNYFKVSPNYSCM